MPEIATVEALVEAARDGDREAWRAIVERYAPLVWGICRRHRLDRADADDVGQIVWLALYERLGSIRDPAALPGWLATTTHHACGRVHRAANRNTYTLLESDLPIDGGFDAVDDELERERERIILRAAFAELRPNCRDLLTLLFSNSRLSYREIGIRLNMKVGSIGPTRERCLAQLRRTHAVAALIEDEHERAAD